MDKVKRDPYYGPLSDRGASLQDLTEWGYFEDTSETDLTLTDVYNLCTPFPQYQKGVKPIVLVATGAYAPIHEGHIQSMIAAKQAAEDAGYTVIGAYFSPGHDEYISSKCGEQAIPAPTRLAMCAEAIKPYPWMMVDPWESLYRPVAVNFTEVVYRLERYLQHHISPDVQVMYVCGGDNARFCMTFQDKGLCVVVNRPVYEDRYLKYQGMLSNPRILWASCNHTGSSSSVRKGDTSILSPSVKRMMCEGSPQGLILRTEDVSVVAHLGIPRGAWLGYLSDLESMFSRLFKGNVKTVSVQSQRDRASHMTPHRISLDPMIPAEHNLSMSRLFDMGGYSPRGYVNRPGTPSLEEQVKVIPDGPYTLFDDDIVSGGTMRYAESILPERIQVEGWTHLETSEQGVMDVADSRDFFMGSVEGGLVVQLPNGKLGRVPYLYPFVDPTTRTSIPSESGMEFSRRLWVEMAYLYRNAQAIVRQLPEASREVLYTMGYQDEDSVYDVAMGMCRIIGLPSYCHMKPSKVKS